MNNANDPQFLNGDDEATIAYVLKNIPASVRSRVDEDDVQYFLDVEFDFFDEKGFLDESSETITIDEGEMSAYILKAARKDKMEHLDEEVVEAFIAAEYQYNESLYRS